MLDQLTPIGIMAAMTEEIHLLDQHLDLDHAEDHGGRRYEQGTLFGRNVIIARSGIGKVAATSTAVELISRFGVKAIVFTGVAGAVDPSLRVGDLVVADSFIQHDMDATPLFERYEIPLISGPIITPPLLPGVQAAAERFIANDFAAHVPNSAIEKLSLSAPKVVSGLVASGDQFFGSAHSIEQFRARLPAARCVEMEGAAVAQVCHQYAVPLGLVRIISDSGDDNAVDHFWEALAAIASAYAVGILQNILES